MSKTQRRLSSAEPFSSEPSTTCGSTPAIHYRVTVAYNKHAMATISLGGLRLARSMDTTRVTTSFKRWWTALIAALS